MSDEDDAFGWAIRRAFLAKDAEIERLTAALAAAKSERDALRLEYGRMLLQRRAFR